VEGRFCPFLNGHRQTTLSSQDIAEHGSHSEFFAKRGEGKAYTSAAEHEQGVPAHHERRATSPTRKSPSPSKDQKAEENKSQSSGDANADISAEAKAASKMDQSEDTTTAARADVAAAADMDQTEDKDGRRHHQQSESTMDVDEKESEQKKDAPLAEKHHEPKVHPGKKGATRKHADSEASPSKRKHEAKQQLMEEGEGLEGETVSRRTRSHDRRQKARAAR
jgi:hypothetical protein